MLEASDKEALKLKSGGEKMRSNVTIGDETMTSISVTLWASMCLNNEDLKPGEVVALKGARLSEYGIRSLNADEDHATLVRNPTHSRSDELKKW